MVRSVNDMQSGSMTKDTDRPIVWFADHVIKVPNSRWSQVADDHLGPPQMAIGHLDRGSNVRSSNLMINLLMIGCLSLGLNG